MSSENLFSLARSKLHLSVGSKDNCSLHRWVLLKNSIIHSPTQTHSNISTNSSDSSLSNPLNDVEVDDDVQEVSSSVEVDSFMFPDAGKLVSSQNADVNASEAQWLDSLLETLGDDDESYEFNVDSENSDSVIQADDDEDHFLSPIGSPMSSSDDLVNQPAYYPSPTTVQYTPCPTFIHPYNFDSAFDSAITSLPAPYEDPLPYHDISSDLEDLSVPDAIEDNSDDESDSPPTPSFGRSSSSLSLLDPAMVPLPSERSRLRHSVPHVYIDLDEPYFLPFDPLPFPEDHHQVSYNPYHQEC